MLHDFAVNRLYFFRLPEIFIVEQIQNNNRRHAADSITNTARLGRRISVLKLFDYITPPNILPD